MRTLFFLLLFSLLARAEQVTISDVTVDFPILVKKTFDSKENPQAPLETNVAATVTHHAKNADSSMEFTVSRITYTDAHKPIVERETRAALNRIMRMPGVENSRQAMADAKVSNLDAKRLSFRCDRMKKKVCIESLYVVRKQVLYVVQIVFIENDATLAQVEAMLSKVQLAAE